MAHVADARERIPRSHPPEVELVRVSGSHREMGRAQGRALGSRVRDAASAMSSTEAFQLLKPRLLPGAIFAAVASRRAQALLERPLARHRPEQLERMLGLAEGAGLAPRSVFLVQGAEVLLQVSANPEVWSPTHRQGWNQSLFSRAQELGVYGVQCMGLRPP
jgi:hypothetical protein